MVLTPREKMHARVSVAYSIFNMVEIIVFFIVIIINANRRSAKINAFYTTERCIACYNQSRVDPDHAYEFGKCSKPENNEGFHKHVNLLWRQTSSWSDIGGNESMVATYTSSAVVLLVMGLLFSVGSNIVLWINGYRQGRDIHTTLAMMFNFFISVGGLWATTIVWGLFPLETGAAGTCYVDASSPGLRSFASYASTCWYIFWIFTWCCTQVGMNQGGADARVGLLVCLLCLNFLFAITFLGILTARIGHIYSHHVHEEDQVGAFPVLLAVLAWWNIFELPCLITFMGFSDRFYRYITAGEFEPERGGLLRMP